MRWLSQTPIGCYAYNAMPGWGLAGEKLNPAPYASLPLNNPANWHLTRENEVVAPSNLIAIGDAVISSYVWSDPGAYNTYELLNPNLFEVAGDFGLFAGWGFYTKEQIDLVHAAVKRRHNARWQIVFCDGHEESLSARDLWDISKESVRCRWSRANVP